MNINLPVPLKDSNVAGFITPIVEKWLIHFKNLGAAPALPIF